MMINQFTPKMSYVELYWDDENKVFVFNKDDFNNLPEEIYDAFLETFYHLVPLHICVVVDSYYNNSKYLVWYPKLTKSGVKYKYSFLTEEYFNKLTGME